MAIFVAFAASRHYRDAPATMLDREEPTMLRAIALGLGILAMTTAFAADQARTWFAIGLNGNVCLNMQEFGQELMQYGGKPAFSPQNLVDWLRVEGSAPETTITKLGTGQIMATVSWFSPRNGKLQREFFSDSADCQLYVARLINGGDVAAPGQLR